MIPSILRVMGPTLRIVWDGDVPGLEDRRLSLAAFEPALRELLSAVRRIATDLERDAWPVQKVHHAGRLSKEASNLDLQISTITANSPVAIEMTIVELSPPAQRPLIEDVGTRALGRFLDDLRLEAAGTAAHYRVRNYLKSLPVGLTTQQYVQRDADGAIIRQIELGAVRVPQPPSSAHLVEVIGEVVGVGFEPGRSEVKLKAFTSETINFAATPEQVDAAISRRGSEVTALGVVEPQRTRLLRLGLPVGGLSPAERLDYVFGTWGGLLERLAK